MIKDDPVWRTSTKRVLRTRYITPLCRAFRKCESRKRMGSWFIGEQKNFRCARVTDAARTSDELGGRNPPTCDKTDDVDASRSEGYLFFFRRISAEIEPNLRKTPFVTCPDIVPSTWDDVSRFLGKHYTCSPELKQSMSFCALEINEWMFHTWISDICQVTW